MGKAEFTKGEANPRFVVTSLTPAECKTKYLYEQLYCGSKLGWRYVPDGVAASAAAR